MTAPSSGWRSIVALLLIATVVSAAHAQGYTPAPDDRSRPAASASPLDALKGWLGGSNPQAELLEPDQAFRISVRAQDPRTLVATLTPRR